jgi:hypothetical protein
MIAYYEEDTASSSRILVIKGQVTNLSPEPKSEIRIYAYLLDNTDHILMEQTVFAGNVLTRTKIKEETRVALEKALSKAVGDQMINISVGQGKSIPFMVLFFDAPENIDSYKIQGKDREEATPLPAK